MDIKDILFNPTNYSLTDLKGLINRQETTAEELKTVLPVEAYNLLTLDQVGETSLPHTYIYELTDTVGRVNHREMTERNVILLWGWSGCGKTALTTSLVNAKNAKLPVMKFGFAEKSQQKLATQRYDLSTLWSKANDGWAQLNISRLDDTIEVVHIDRRPRYFGRRYSFTFAEVNLTDEKGQRTDWKSHLQAGSRFYDSILKPNTGHIHLFCLDCSPERDLKLQVSGFEQVVNELKRSSLINETSALYIVVMKADLMKAPKPFLDNAAQTLVTSQLSDFWQTVRNHCYDKHIYNTQPLTSSVGDFVLKDLARPNSEYTEHIFSDTILPKCTPRKWWYERWLGFKLPVWLKWLVLPIVLMLMLMGMGLFYDNIVGRPTSQVTSFDYANYFSKEIITNLRGVGYNQAHQSYQRLNADLHTERSLRTSSDDLVITDSVAEHCDQLLTTAFAPILKKELEEFFEVNGWSQQYGRISNLKADISTINGKPELTAVQRARFDSSKEYFAELNRINDFIGRCSGCSAYDVLLQLENDYGKKRATWTAKPFSADNLLLTRITDAVYVANKSYVYYCQSWLQSPLNTYYDRIRYLNKQYKENGMEWSTYKQHVYNAKKKLQQDAQRTITKASIMNSHLSEKGSDYYDLRETLSNKIEEVNKATNDISQWQSLTQNLTSKLKSLFN